MLKTILTRSLLLIFSFGLLCAPGVLGQTCSLRLNVWDLRKVPVSGANATARRRKSAYHATSNNNGVAFFSRLPIGRYAITVTRAGYQPAGTTVNCNTANKSAYIIMGRLELDKLMVVDSNKDTSVQPTVTATPGKNEDDNDGPRPTPKPIPKIVSKGVINGSAISLPKPVYPRGAKAAGASGAVNVQVTLDEDGNVISAMAVSGHPLLRQVSVEAARGAKFRPTLLSGVPVKVSGIIVYNFQ